MGNYDNIVKIEEIRKKVDEGDLLSAQKILDIMDLKKIKNISDLSLLAEVYKENERFDDAAGLYHKIYQKTKTRKTSSQLIDIYIRKGNSQEAGEFLSQYQKAYQEDFDYYIFRYKIEKLEGASYEQLIEILKRLNNLEYTEKWAYELAKLYYKAGMEEECKKECTEIILWFGEGAYVEKAKMLRAIYSGETDKEKMMEELKRRSEEAFTVITTETKEEDLEDGQEEIYSDADFMANEEEEFQMDLKKNILDIMSEGDTYDEEEDEEYEGDWQQTQENEEYESEEPVASENVEDESEEPVVSENVEYESEEPVASENVEYESEEHKTSENEGYVSDELKASEEAPKIKVDDEDIKLGQIAEEYQLNPEDIFGDFLHVSSIKKQISTSLEQIVQLKKGSVFVIITGTAGSGKTTLSKDMALFLSKTDKIQSSKVAKISGNKLNTVDLDSKKNTLKGCCLVIENASELKRETIEKLLKLTKDLQGDMAVIFEEDKKNMNKLFRECPRLMDIRIRIHLPQYTREDMTGFALAYIRKQDYRLSKEAENVLQNKLNLIAKQSEPQYYLEKIRNLMQSAMEAADIRAGKQLSSLAAEGRLQEAELMIIHPEDFN